MSWTSVTPEETRTALLVVEWIRTARAAGYGGPDWLPCQADISKSALFERLRSGKAPLPEPPPLGLSCPWYAIVEDPGPHYAWEVQRGTGDAYLATDEFSVFQNVYRLVEERGAQDFVVRDVRHETSYRFRLWFDPDWTHPNDRTGARAKGGWFIQNTSFAFPATT